jgi:hypothetical protein
MESLRTYWENLSERERRLLGVLGAVVLLIGMGLPSYFLWVSIDDLQKENRELVAVLDEVAAARPRLAQRAAERAAAEARYAQRAPALGTFLEAQAERLEGLEISDGTPQPERQEGRFTIRHQRARFQNTGLRSAIMLMAAIKNSQYPVSLERIHIDHVNDGDRYNIQIGVLAFDRQGASSPDAGVPSAGSGSSGGSGAGGGSGRPTIRANGRSGPPAP